MRSKALFSGGWRLGLSARLFTMAFMLLLKSFHIVLVTSWFAALFYLPRIFVNLALVDKASEAEYARLVLMASKLWRFGTILAVLAVSLGLWLWLGYGFSGLWLHIKFALVLILLAYHGYCGRILRHFAAGQNRRSHRWFRWFNEIPVFFLLGITLLVVLKPSL